MRPDGSAVSLLGGGIAGWSPAWSTDGRQIAFEAVSFYAYAADLYVMSVDGSAITLRRRRGYVPSRGRRHRLH